MTHLGLTHLTLAALLTALLPMGTQGQKLSIDPRKVEVPSITGTDVIQLEMADGWPQRIRFYHSRPQNGLIGFHPIRLRVGVANVSQVDDVRVLDKSSRPAFGFETQFSNLSPTECPSGSSVCVEVDIGLVGPSPGTYQIGVAGGGPLLRWSAPIEVMCSPFSKPVTLSLSPKEQMVSRGTTIMGEVRLGCPALPPGVPTNWVEGLYSPSPTVGATVVRLSRANLATGGELLTYPDSVIVQPGQSAARFQIEAPVHAETMSGIHPHTIAAPVRAELMGPQNTTYAQETGRFLYAVLQAISAPGDLVGNDPVTIGVSLTQPSAGEEEICVQVLNERGIIASLNGGLFTISGSGSGPDSGCVTLSPGATTGSLQLQQRLSPPLNQAEDFVIQGTQRHRSADGRYWSTDTLSIPFRAWPTPTLLGVTFGAPPSSREYMNSFVNGAVDSQASGYVELASAAPPGGVFVELACKPHDEAGEQLCSRHISLPDGVRVPQGVREFGFPIGISRTSVEGDVTIRAQAGGREAGRLFHVDQPPEVTGVHLGISGGPNSRTLLVQVEEIVRVEPIRVALKISGDGAQFFQIPEFVEIPVGELHANFTIPMTPLPEAVELTLTAVREGGETPISNTQVIQP